MHVVRRLGNSSAPFKANFRYISCLFQNCSDIEEEEAEDGDGDDDDQEDDGEDDDGDDVLTVRSKGGQSPTGARILTSHLPGHAHQQHHRQHHHHLLHHHHTWTNAISSTRAYVTQSPIKDDLDVSHLLLTQLC